MAIHGVWIHCSIIQCLKCQCWAIFFFFSIKQRRLWGSFIHYSELYGRHPTYSSEIQTIPRCYWPCFSRRRSHCWCQWSVLMQVGYCVQSSRNRNYVSAGNFKTDFFSFLKAYGGLKPLYACKNVSNYERPLYCC